MGRPKRPIPSQRFATLRAHSFFVVVPDDTALFGTEDALFILAVVEREQQALQNLTSALARGAAVGVSLNRKQASSPLVRNLFRCKALICNHTRP